MVFKSSFMSSHVAIRCSVKQHRYQQNSVILLSSGLTLSIARSSSLAFCNRALFISSNFCSCFRYCSKAHHRHSVTSLSVASGCVTIPPKFSNPPSSSRSPVSLSSTSGPSPADPTELEGPLSLFDSNT